MEANELLFSFASIILFTKVEDRRKEAKWKGREI